jgi:hypothetical protein
MPKTITESPPEGLEVPEVSLPEIVSDPSAGEPISGGEAINFDPDQMGKLADALTELVVPKIRETLRPDIETGIQSTKDIRFKKLDGLDPEDVGLVAAALKRADGDPERAALDLGIQGILEERRNPPTSEPVTASLAAPVSSPDSDVSEAERKDQVKKILADSGLNADDTAVVLDGWGKKSFHTVDDSLAELTKMAISQVREPQTLPAGSISPTGVAAIGAGDNEQALVDLYNELSTLQKEPTKNAAQITKVKESLNKMGEDIT